MLGLPLCPKDSKTSVKVVDTFKILGAVPLRCQMIQICVPQKRLTHFIQQIGTFQPAGRQKFGNAL